MTERPDPLNDRPTFSAEQIEEAAAFDRLISNSERVLVDFYADWCGPCRLMAPVVDELAADSEAAIAEVDVEVHPQIAIRYDGSSVPRFVAIEDGEVEARLVGRLPVVASSRTMHEARTPAVVRRRLTARLIRLEPPDGTTIVPATSRRGSLLRT